MSYFNVTARPKPGDLNAKLQQLCVNIPPDAQLGKSESIIKIDRGIYLTGFSSQLSYRQIKAFYSQLPALNDWKISESSKEYGSDYRETHYYLSFRNDGYEITVTTSNLSEDRSKKSFGLECSWQAY